MRINVSFIFITHSLIICHSNFSFDVLAPDATFAANIDCPSNFNRFSVGCYYLDNSTNGSTWQQASQICSNILNTSSTSIATHLLLIDNQSEADGLQYSLKGLLLVFIFTLNKIFKLFLYINKSYT